MELKKRDTPRSGGNLFIVSPTLDMLLSQADNVKMIADVGGIEYSNFVKACKFEKDLRISSYEKCATAFGKDTLIIHLPIGMIDSLVDAKTHLNNRCRIIDEKDFVRVLLQLFKTDKSQLLLQIELLLLYLEEQKESENIKKLVSYLVDFLQKVLKDYGNT